MCTHQASLSGTFLPNYETLDYSAQGVLFLLVHLSTDAATGFRNVWVPELVTDFGSNLASKHANKHEARPPVVKKKEEKKNVIA